ncbi:MAG TPA: hypothetical protein VL201_01990, partial [Patescibacteria group bacterium]|nr:hypothetical protein [Patescibacteria group bacterium]
APFKGGEEYQNHLKRLKNPVILELINTEIEVLLERLQRKHKGIQIPRPLKKRKEENNTLQKINNYVGPKPTIIQKKISCLKTSDHRKNAPAKEYPKRTCTKRYQRAFTKNNLMTLLFINSLCIL